MENYKKKSNVYENSLGTEVVTRREDVSTLQRPS